MFSSASAPVKRVLSKFNYLSINHKRHAQVSIIGAANGIGSNLALLLKQNHNIKRLNLYDDSERVIPIGADIAELPGVARVTTYCGHSFLPASIRSSHLIVMVYRIPRRPGYNRSQMLAANAPAVQRLCRSIADVNPQAFLAISTNPINSIIPFASALLFKYCAYDAGKIFGITHIDTIRAKAYVAKTLNINPGNLDIPVIGGHSDETIVPLFSSMSPSHHRLDTCQADTLTKLVKKAGMEVIRNKQGIDSSVLAMAWSVNEFVGSLVDALSGGTTTVNALTSNPHHGTRFFAGPTTVGCYGIVETCGANYEMSEYERYLLGNAITTLNKEVMLGEDYARMEAAKL
ncbi:unnamed protein product [Leptosia nina]|uniref:Malate dehydrogenase, mitochondrial n=1 Tax=Leptosia nina TaxID=320188 RepID=A0AAV1JQZ1_9NEOP